MGAMIIGVIKKRIKPVKRLIISAAGGDRHHRDRGGTG